MKKYIWGLLLISLLSVKASYAQEQFTIAEKTFEYCNDKIAQDRGVWWSLFTYRLCFFHNPETNPDMIDSTYVEAYDALDIKRKYAIQVPIFEENVQSITYEKQADSSYIFKIVFKEDLSSISLQIEKDEITAKYRSLLTSLTNNSGIILGEIRDPKALDILKNIHIFTSGNTLGKIPAKPISINGKSIN